MVQSTQYTFKFECQNESERNEWMQEIEAQLKASMSTIVGPKK